MKTSDITITFCKSLRLLTAHLHPVVLFVVSLIAFFGMQLDTHAATINVPLGGDFQAALNQAQPGDTIVLTAGAVYTGPFTLPVKNNPNNYYITIQSSALTALPGPGQRISPSNAANMPRIVAPNSDNALRTAPSASYYQVIGIEFAPVNASAIIYDLLLLGDGGSAQNSLSLVPHHLTIDRCYIHGYATEYVKRGIALNSSETSVINSYISDIHVEGQDSQGLGGWNGPGPFHIINNFVAAAGQNIIFGGALPSIQGLVPSDIEILRNYLFKPLSWKPGEPSYAGIPWTVKALLELKSAKRVTIEGNLMENQWDNYNGYGAINFTVRNDSGSWATIQNVEFRNNIVRHLGLGMNILGLDTVGPTVQGHDVRIYNNVFDDINEQKWQEDGWWIKMSSMNNLTLDHNTVFQSSNIIWVYGPANTGFVMTNNIAPHNSYGIIGASHGSGADTLNTYFPNYVMRRNVIPGASSGYPNYYPTDNFYPATLDAVGFVNRTGGDYHLAASSPYKNQATDGKDVGCDIDALNNAMTGSLSGTPVVWTNLVGVSASGNNLTKTAASAWSNAGASSTKAIAFGDGYVEFTATEINTSRMCGLSKGDSDQRWQDIDYALYVAIDDTIEIFEGGVYRGDFGTYTAGDRFRVAVEGGVVKYRRNGGLLYTSTVAPAYPLLVDTALHTNGATLTNVVIYGTLQDATQDVVWTNAVGVSVSANSLTMTAPSGWGNAGASSTRAIASGDGYVEFTATETNRSRMCGLSKGDTNQTWQDIDYAIYVAGDDTIEIFEAGVYRGDFGTYAAGDRFRVAVEGGVVQYRKNGVLLYSSGVTPNYPLLVDTALAHTGATLTNVVIYGTLTP
jgi:hypothetical protein